VRYFTYIEPDWDSENLDPIYITKSEDEIIQEYFPYWSEQMKTVNKEHLIDREACIDDWTVVNLAWEVQD
jgi:hypothetical protein